MNDTFVMLKVVIYGLVLIVVLLSLIISKTNQMKDQITKLAADVAAQKTVIDSTKTLLTGLNDRLKAASVDANNGDTAALDAIIAEVEAQTADLSASVAANTPADATPAS